jgi:hypothetical protein
MYNGTWSNSVQMMMSTLATTAQAAVALNCRQQTHSTIFWWLIQRPESTSAMAPMACGIHILNRLLPTTV